MTEFGRHTGADINSRWLRAPATSFTCSSRSSCTRPSAGCSAFGPAPGSPPGHPAPRSSACRLRHQHDRFDQRPDRLPDLGPSSAASASCRPPPSAGRSPPGPGCSRGFGSGAVASSASSASRRRSRPCIRAFIDGSYIPSSIARIIPSIRRLPRRARSLGRQPGPGARLQPVVLGRELGHEHPNSSGSISRWRRASSTVVSSTSRRMVSRLSAGALVARRRAAEMVQADLGEPAAADPAAHQPREQVARPAPIPERRLAAPSTLLVAGRLPLPLPPATDRRRRSAARAPRRRPAARSRSAATRACRCSGP